MGQHLRRVFIFQNYEVELKLQINNVLILFCFCFLKHRKVLAANQCLQELRLKLKLALIVSTSLVAITKFLLLIAWIVNLQDILRWKWLKNYALSLWSLGWKIPICVILNCPCHIYKAILTHFETLTRILSN